MKTPEEKGLVSLHKGPRSWRSRLSRFLNLTSAKKLNIERTEALVTLLQLGGMLTESVRQACGKLLSTIPPLSLRRDSESIEKGKG